MSLTSQVVVHSPATVANVNCGFDVLGFCLENVCDKLALSVRTDKQLNIINETPYSVPADPNQNVTTIALQAMLSYMKKSIGLDVVFQEKIRPGSGIGSSAASCCAGVAGLNVMLGMPFSKKKLIDFALKGEQKASQAVHADNIAPCMLGGMCLIYSNAPFQHIALPYPENLSVCITQPDIQLMTQESRMLLPKSVSVRTTIQQGVHLATFVAGLYEKNRLLIRRGAKDFIAEPYRKSNIPHFDMIKKEVLNMKEALAFGISGSGPCLFALSNSLNEAEKIRLRISQIYEEKQILHKSFTSGINTVGVKVDS